MKRIIEMISKHKEIILYVFFGVLTTAVNFVVYFACRHIGVNVKAATILAWLLSVLFAYVTNKRLVFKSDSKGAKNTLIELSVFMGGRLTSGLIDLIIMVVFVDYLKLYEPLVKIGSNVIVIVLNYIISKFLVFIKR